MLSVVCNRHAKPRKERENLGSYRRKPNFRSLYAIIGFDASRRLYFLSTFLNVFSGHTRAKKYVPMDEVRLREIRLNADSLMMYVVTV